MALRYYVSSEEAPFFVNNKMGSSDSTKIVSRTGYDTSDVKIGTMIYDNTLNKPLWWDGTSWRDANGTIV